MINGAGWEGSSHMFEVEGATHPCLLIKDILELIFNHILDTRRSRKDVVKDVLSIRLVSKPWKDSVTPLYRPTGPLITFEEYDLMNKSEGRLPFTAFMDMAKSCIKMIPVQKFEFRWSVFRDVGGPVMFRDFLLLCGPQLVFLKLDIRSSDADRIMKLDYLSEVRMKKLKTLELSMDYGDHRHLELRQPLAKVGQIYALANLVELFLNAARTLEMLKLVYQFQDILMQQLGTILATRIPRTVKRLEFYTEFDEQIFDNLADAGLGLECFKLIGIPSRSRTLYKFLERQAATLKELQIWDFLRRDQQELGVIVEFPPLRQLTHLELPNLTVAAPFDFTEAFPKLQSLNIRGLSSVNSLLTLLSSVKSPPESLTVLHLPNWQFTSLTPFVKSVATSFPCIAELHISPSRDFGNETTLEKVFKYFVNLESLSFRENEGMVTISGWAEYVFSGISERDSTRIRELQDFGNVDLNNFRRRRQPSILNLTKLKKFVVETDCQKRHRFSFTDFSAHFIFLEMENLREIRLPNSAVQFSPKYLDLLGDRLVLLDG